MKWAWFDFQTWNLQAPAPVCQVPYFSTHLKRGISSIGRTNWPKRLLGFKHKKSMSRIVLMLFALGFFQSVSQPGQAWKINEKESHIIFIAKNFGMTVTGKMSGMKVTGEYHDDNILGSKLEGSLDVATIDTGIGARDNHLRSSDYFDAKKFPTIKFKTTSITTEGAVLVATGLLTIKGVTKEEKIKFTVERNGHQRIFKGDITVLRRNYELGGNTTLIMADTIRVRLQVVFELPASVSKL